MLRKPWLSLKFSPSSDRRIILPVKEYVLLFSGKQKPASIFTSVQVPLKIDIFRARQPFFLAKTWIEIHAPLEW